MAASTASACRRSEAELTHSQSRSQAVWRETFSGMAVTVAEPSVRPPRPTEELGGGSAAQRLLNRPGRGQSARLRASLRKDMEKFVIEGGRALSGDRKSVVEGSRGRVGGVGR